MKHAVLMTELQSERYFFDDGLNGVFRDQACGINFLIVLIWGEGVLLRVPVQQLTTWTVLHDDDQFVFKASFVIDNFKQSNDIRTGLTFCKAQHGFDFAIHYLHELVSGDHTASIFAPMVLFLRPQHLFFPNL